MGQSLQSENRSSVPNYLTTYTMVKNVPSLKEILRTDGEWNIRRTTKGSRVTFLSAFNAKNLQSHRGRAAIIDEISSDAYDPSGKTKEDKIEAAMERTGSFPNRKNIIGGTPSIAGRCRITSWFLRGDQRRWFVPDPETGEMHEPQMGDRSTPYGLRWNDRDASTVRYRFPSGAELTEREFDKDILPHGRFIPTAEGEPGHASFAFNALISPMPRADWEVIVHKWLSARDQVRDNPGPMKSFYNTVLGQAFEDFEAKKGVKSIHELQELQEPYDSAVPPGVNFLTASVDVQSGDGGWFAVKVVGWGYNERCHVIGYWILKGEPFDGVQEWLALEDFLRRGFLGPDGKPMYIQGASIDSGGHYTQEVYDFCEKHRARRWFPIKGKRNAPGVRSDEIWPKEVSVTDKGRVYLVDVDIAKDTLFRRLHGKPDAPNAITFPLNPLEGSSPLDADYFTRLTKEKKEWVPGATNYRWTSPRGQEPWDPETGDPLVPEAPAPGMGEVLALHSGALSRTTDGGAKWRLLPGVDFPYNFAALIGQGVMTATIDGRAIYTNDFARFSQIPFPSETLTEISVENSDFETEDLTGWQLVSGTEPTVLDTVQPPQKGGTFYLTRDHAAEGAAPFEVEQQIQVPAQAGKLRVSVDALSAVGSAASIRLIDTNAAPIDLFNDPSSTSSKSRGDSWRFRNVAQKDGRLIDAITTITNAFWSSYRYIPRQGGIEYDFGADFEWAFYRFDFVDSVTGDPVELGGKFRLNNFFSQTGTDNGNPRSAAFHMTPEFIDTTYGSNGFKVIRGADSDISLGTNSGLQGFSVKANKNVDVVVSILPTTSFEARIKHNANSGDNILNISDYGGRGDIGSALAGTFASLVDTSFEVDLDGTESELAVQLVGSGDGDVYFDNVRVDLVEDRDKTVRVVSRDLAGRRFVVGTETSLHSWSKLRGREYIGPLPFAPLFLESHGDRVVISDGAQVGFSSDGGLTFSTFAQAGISQVFAHPEPLVVTGAGEVFAVSESGLTSKFTGEAGSFYAYDAKRKQFYLTQAGPDIAKTKSWSAAQPHSSMPKSDTAGNAADDRRIIALDSGRILGWVPGSRDLFQAQLQDGSSEWRVSLPLKNAIQDLQEVK